MKPIAIFYHALFVMGDPPKELPNAEPIVGEQMGQLMASGLLKQSEEFHVGINGGEESKTLAAITIPSKAQFVFHGLDSRAENPTIAMLEEWVKTHNDWNVLYIHSKAVTHDPSSQYGQFCNRWRRGMMHDLVTNWRFCVSELEKGYDIVTSYWMWSQCDGTQHIPAGNFLWINSSFAQRLPSIYLRDRIKISGIGALESRHEAEVYWGNGPLPNVRTCRSKAFTGKSSAADLFYLYGNVPGNAKSV